MLVENIVAQTLTATGHKLYFFSQGRGASSDGRMEVDFRLTRTVVGRRRNVYAVEVKSGRNTKHVSLDKFRTKHRKSIGGSFLLHTKDVGGSDGIVYLPLYMAMFL